MKVTGFTFIRNAVKYDYPVVESIASILPLCDELIVNIGDSDDGTEQLIANILSPKIRIIHSVWDKSLIEGGRVLAEETNKAYDAISADSDWCFYIQADEVVHEKYYTAIRNAMNQYKDDTRVEGLLFRYLHFYGSYDYVGDTRKWYSHEIRIVRKDSSIRSYRDAQGFRKDGKKLKVKEIDAYIYHYGWVRHPELQLRKRLGFEKLYNTDELASKISKKESEQFDYSEIDSLTKFTGTHPITMHDRIRKKNWSFDHDLSKKNFSLKGRLLHLIERFTGKRLFDYRNYEKIS
jgi:hypothetical protein